MRVLNVANVKACFDVVSALKNVKKVAEAVEKVERMVMRSV
jgi:hypothetical protein